ncbi:50S ribosomal protein L14e [Candidatus Bathyarchaeota archaeon]|nr:50S ribosomal protein L14e [Candidatus Bathyarchaeota archaeon]
MGREAGQKCVVVSVADKNFVLVTGPKSLTGVRRRRVNVSHLAFTPYKLNIKENASDEEVLKTIQESGLIDFMKEEASVKFE